VINLTGEKCIVLTKDGNTINEVGRIVGGVGGELIKMAVDSIDDGRSTAAKLAANTRKAKRLRKISELKSVLDSFEGSVPQDAMSQFNKVVDYIADWNDAYKRSMYEEIMANVNVNPQMWPSILTWFQSNVIDVESTRNKFQLRKAFVTTVCRMGPQEYRVGNALKGVEENTADFWDEYAADKKPE
jgi:hypothetical protein